MSAGRVRMWSRDQTGSRTRVSTFLAGGFLLVLMLALGDAAGRISMTALAAVMIVVAIGTFYWHSLRTLRRMRPPDGTSRRRRP